MSDLILILFNNIIDYIEDSGKKSDTKVEINDMEDIIEVKVANKLFSKDIQEREDYVKKAQEKFGKTDFLKNSSRDKGYGHVKAYNIIHSILPYDPKAFVLDVEDGYFVVTFRIDVTYWKAYEDTRC